MKYLKNSISSVVYKSYYLFMVYLTICHPHAGWYWRNMALGPCLLWLSPWSPCLLGHVTPCPAPLGPHPPWLEDPTCCPLPNAPHSMLQLLVFWRLWQSQEKQNTKLPLVYKTAQRNKYCSDKDLYRARKWTQAALQWTLLLLST